MKIDLLLWILNCLLLQLLVGSKGSFNYLVVKESVRYAGVGSRVVVAFSASSYRPSPFLKCILVNPRSLTCSQLIDCHC